MPLGWKGPGLKIFALCIKNCTNYVLKLFGTICYMFLCCLQRCVPRRPRCWHCVRFVGSRLVLVTRCKCVLLLCILWNSSRPSECTWYSVPNSLELSKETHLYLSGCSVTQSFLYFVCLQVVWERNGLASSTVVHTHSCFHNFSVLLHWFLYCFHCFLFLQHFCVSMHSF